MLPATDDERAPRIGAAQPRLAPPRPARSLLKEWEAAAIKPPLPWQPVAARYMMATRPDGRWLYDDICIIAGRQNGKTELLLPRILYDLRQGRRVLHTAHRMRLVRKLFTRVARIVEDEGAKVRYTHGEEEITHPSGGSYATVAALRGARGDSTDTLIIDETAEFEDYEAMEAAIPTLGASQHALGPQTIFLSTAGKDASIVLNAIRRRGDENDPTLAYLEWSARPDRHIDDLAGWAEANPALGHFPHLLSFLHKQRKMYAEDPSGFEREHLSRWDPRLQTRVVSADAWSRCRSETGDPERPAMAFNMDGQSSRASAVLAWRMADGRIGVKQLVDARNFTTDDLHEHLRKLATEHRARQIGYASWTDAALARGWKRAKALDGKTFAAACGKFAELVQAGRLAWDGEELIGDDLAFATRKTHETGAWVAMPASQERSITAALAAIRAVYLAAERPNLPRIG